MNENDLLKIELRDVDDMYPNPKNPRVAGNIAELAKSITDNEQFFIARPILLSNRTGSLVIIGGERRWEAAKYLGMKKAPSILFEGLTEGEEDEIMFKDNTHNGKWDVKKLNNWNRFLLKKWGVDDFGKSSKEGSDKEFENKFNSITNNEALYPIVPRFDEDYEVICIVCKTSIDANFLREKLGLNKMKSYKRGTLGKSNVISFEDLKDVLY